MPGGKWRTANQHGSIKIAESVANDDTEGGRTSRPIGGATRNAVYRCRDKDHEDQQQHETRLLQRQPDTRGHFRRKIAS